MESYLSLTVELIVGLFGLLILTRLMGRASISEATPFDFVSVLIVGDFVGEAIYNKEVKVFFILYAIFLWGLLIILIDLITLKFNKTRYIFESTPSLIIDNGVLDRKEMKRNKLDINKLQMMLRDKDVFSIREVAFAILEPNGKISVIKKPKYESPPKLEKSSSINTVSLPVTLISDGKILLNNIKKIGKTSSWLTDELHLRGIQDPKTVFFAEWRLEDGLFIQTSSPKTS
ncbi:DUF421 domain-containing protein [Terrilactibacillus sp. BCM23-1]|uniref:DUF421 domain-containing protein n=1 Tax=Terrilactibacillus tamarindi TaxID=2599694 RepID=A0A6N8CL47_9BACI|nr:DUF421 domain-containing protein [Terrilactibacillus tamarindi]MTT30594.1 DUF421 domain-containing protein [Terrilactibacillus tamarindi]